MMPLVAVGMASTLYTVTSPYEREDAFRHLIAMGGCEAAEKVGLVHISAGAPGYHSKFDPDGNGISCEDPMATHLEAAAIEELEIGAKFLRP